MKPQEFIADLCELKNGLSRPFSDNSRYVEPSITYAIIESLIAQFMSKYDVKYEEIVDVLRLRSITSTK